MSVVRLFRPEISEQAQIEIDRWRGIANRNQDMLTDERQGKWSLIKIAYILGVASGVIGVLLWL